MEQKNRKCIVVAKYQEDTTWTNKIDNCDIIIYRKGHNIPNIGREDYTYLYHIVNNYNNLHDFTVFCQGNPFDHCKNFLKIIHTEKEFYALSNVLVHDDEYGHPNHTNNMKQKLPIGEKSKELLNDNRKIFRFNPGAQFILSKNRIQLNSLDFYQKLLKYSETDKLAPWTLERLWRIIFKED